MKPQINADGRRLHPAKMTTWEFLDEQFYQRVLRGRFQEEFDRTKRRLKCLKPFRTPVEFMRVLWNNKRLRGKIVRELEALWKKDSGFRQNSGAVLLMAQWHNVIGAGDDYWSDYFINLAEESRNAAGSNSLITPCGLTASKRGVPCEE